MRTMIIHTLSYKIYSLKIKNIIKTKTQMVLDTICVFVYALSIMLDEYIKALVATIKELRIRQNLTQEQMAFEINISTSYLGMIERGERNLSMKNIYQIAKFFHMTPAEFFSLVEQKTDRN